MVGLGGSGAVAVQTEEERGGIGGGGGGLDGREAGWGSSDETHSTASRWGRGRT